MPPNTVGDAFVALRSDDSRLQSDMEAQLAKALGPVVAKGAKILAGLFVVKEIAGFARAGIAELADAEKQSALTAAQLRATGQAAGINQQHVQELAAANLKLAGTDDEVTVAAERVLLQFSRITAAGGIFDETLRSAQDLAIATGQDLPAATRALGLSLQDPLHATRLLRGENVALTVAQQEQIKAFVDAGNIMGAQRVILDQVSASVGGTAAAYGTTLAGDLQRAQEELKNTRASLVEGAAPALSIFADASVTASEAIQGLPGPLRTTASAALLSVSAFVSLAPAVGSAVSGFRALRPATEGAAQATLFSSTKIGQLGAANRELAGDLGGTTSRLGSFTTGLGAAAIAIGGIATAYAIWAQQIGSVNSEIDKESGRIDRNIAGITSISGLNAALGDTQKAIDELSRQRSGSKAPWDADFRSELGHGIDSLEQLKKKYEDQIAAAEQLAATTGITTDAALKQVRATQAQTGASDEAALAEAALADAQTARFGVITEGVTAEQALERSTRDVAAAQRSAQSAARSLADAQKALTEARKGASAEDITKSELSLESAQIAAVNSAKTVATEEAALQRLRTGTRGTVDELTSAEDRLNSARESQRRANQSLEELERTARINARRGIDLTHEQQLAINDARISAADAAKNTAAEEAKLADLRRPATAEELATQEQKLEQARIANQTAIFAVTDAEKALQDVQAQGTESDQKVIDARQRVADAAQNVADANQRVSDSYLAEVDAVAAQKDAQDALNSVTQTAATRARNLRDALAGVLNQYAPGSQERANVEAEIAALDKLLSQQSAINSGGFNPAQQAVIKSIFPGAFGAATGFSGTITRPTLILAGENYRPEDALIVPHSQGGIPAMSGGGGVVFGPGAVVVQFNGAVPSAAEAFRTGQAVGAGVADTLEARQVRLVRRMSA